MAARLIGCLEGLGKREILADHYCPVSDLWRKEPLSPKIAAIAAGSYKRTGPPEIKGTGYVVDSLEAALWAFYQSSSFKEGALLAVNLGDDADTTGAVYGQIAGAFYGEGHIPREWKEKLARLEVISSMAKTLLELADQSQNI